MNAAIENAMEQQLLHAATVMEQQVDAEINKMEKMDDDDFESLRRKIMDAMKKSQSQKQDWLANGHGKYEEISNEKEFFDACKKSKQLVCHFYRESTFRCKIVDKHLAIIAPKHLETRFIKINVEKCPFLVERLRIVVLPTLCIAKDGKTTDYIVGFDDLGGKDDFPTETMEWRLGVATIINYSGDLLTPPGGQPAKKPSILGHQKKIIRGGDGDDSSDENDW